MPRRTDRRYHLGVDKELTLYGGNFDNYVKTRKEQEINRQKKHEKEQEDIKHLKEFINSCGTYSNLVKQAQSKQKVRAYSSPRASMDRNAAPSTPRH